MNHNDYMKCIGTIINNLLSLPNGSEKETMLFAQFLTIRLAYQNGTDSEELVEIIKFDDEKMEIESDIPYSEIESYRSIRLDRFRIYELEWHVFKTGDYVNSSPFSLARMNIYENDLSFEIFMPFSIVITNAIKQLQSILGQLDDMDDEWENDFMILLEEYQDQL